MAKHKKWLSSVKFEIALLALMSEACGYFDELKT
ncbi:Uncharacterised protein [Legionella waltersii]|nr:Uncharacterised protein [Legionella waltersii]